MWNGRGGPAPTAGRRHATRRDRFWWQAPDDMAGVYHDGDVTRLQRALLIAVLMLIAAGIAVPQLAPTLMPR